MRHPYIKQLAACLACLFCGISAAQSQTQSPVTIDTTKHFYVYHIDFSSIELVCGTMPTDSNIIFCAEAAYTNKPFNAAFTHKKIAGDHVSHGKKYTGGKSPYFSGAFSYHGGRWHYAYNLKCDYASFLDSAAAGGGMGFCQSMVIHNREIVRQARPRIHQVEYYRSLCEKDGQLMVIDTKEKVSFGRFLYMLVEYGVEEAIYMDMGSGWNHSWYRDAEGHVVNIFPKTHSCTTNWISFIKK